MEIKQLTVTVFDLRKFHFKIACSRRLSSLGNENLEWSVHKGIIANKSMNSIKGINNRFFLLLLSRDLSVGSTIWCQKNKTNFWLECSTENQFLCMHWKSYRCQNQSTTPNFSGEKNLLYINFMRLICSFVINCFFFFCVYMNVEKRELKILIPSCVEMQCSARFNGFTQFFLNFNCNTLDVHQNKFEKSNWIAKAKSHAPDKLHCESNKPGRRVNEREIYHSNSSSRSSNKRKRRRLKKKCKFFVAVSFVCNECITLTLN